MSDSFSCQLNELVIDDPRGLSHQQTIRRLNEVVSAIDMSLLLEQAMKMPHEAESEAQWSRRYRKAVDRYDGLDLSSPKAVDAVIVGLMEWVQLVGHASVGPDGLPEPASKWGLGAERGALRAIQSRLVVMGTPLLSDRLRSEMADLIRTAKSIDRCHLQIPYDYHAMKRLVSTAKLQTKALTELLSAVREEFAEHGKVVTKPRRKRGALRKNNPVKDQKMMDEWSQVRGKAGMTRKEFCTLKEITLRQFTQIQDRVRKRSSEKAQPT